MEAPQQVRHWPESRQRWQVRCWSLSRERVGLRPADWQGDRVLSARERQRPDQGSRRQSSGPGSDFGVKVKNSVNVHRPAAQGPRLLASERGRAGQVEEEAREGTRPNEEDAVEIGRLEHSGHQRQHTPGRAWRNRNDTDRSRRSQWAQTGCSTERANAITKGANE